MLGTMSLGYSHTSPALVPVGSYVPWQFRVRPALFVTVGSIVTGLVLIGGLFLVRRLTGALSADLPPPVMLFLALGATSTLAFSRIAWRRSFPLETPEDLSFADQALGWASSAALAMLAVGSCFPANRTTDWLIWLPILVADQFWRQNFFDAGEPWTPQSGQSDSELRKSPSLAITNTEHRDNPELKNIVQQLFRLQDEHHHEVIYGTVRADFVAGQRTAVVHVGFCPPLTYLPEIEAEALPSSRLPEALAKIKVVQALAHGTRLDIRLPVSATTDCQLWIDMAARPGNAQ
ncbi:MAG: hypothetical protein GXP24_01190 [Planctomycetes bacterium]|nr:hypothetical protein [Planctomycetota bacterium]